MEVGKIFSMGLEVFFLWQKKKKSTKKKESPNTKDLGNHYIKVDGLQMIYFLKKKKTLMIFYHYLLPLKRG